MQHNEETFEGKNGIKLFSESWTPEEEPKKAILIIVHGLHDHIGRYAWAAEELAKQGYAIYGFDLRGHGKSGGKSQSVDSFDDYLEDLGRFVRLVQIKEPGKPLFIFGFSMGGNIVASYALGNKTGINGVILSGPGLKPPRNVLLLKLLGPLLPNLGVFRPPSKDFSRDPNVVAEIEKDPLISQKPVPARTLLGIVRTGEKILAEAGNFDIPFLVMQGTADKLVSPEGSKLFNERGHSADKTLKLYEGFYHDLLHEPEKQTVLNDMSGWLGKHS